MKRTILILFLFFSFLHADYFVYEDKSNNQTINYIKTNQSKLFKKTDKTSLAATKSTVWLRVSLTNDLEKEAFQYIRFREAFLYEIELFDDEKIIRGGSTVAFKNRQLAYVTDTFEVNVSAKTSKTVFIKIVPQYNATYAYDIFTSKADLESHNSLFKHIFISYLSVMALILVGAVLIFSLFREKLFAYYIYFILMTITFQVFQSGFILNFIHVPNIVKYDESFALALLIGSALFLKTLFKEQEKVYPFIKYLFRAILGLSFIGIVLLLVSFNYYVDLFVELVVINFGLVSILLFVLFMVIKRVQYSIFALVGMFVFINTSLVCAIYYIGLMDFSYALVVMQIGSIIEALAFLTLILYRIYNHILEEKEKSVRYTMKLNDMQLLAKMGTWTYEVATKKFRIDKPTKEILEVSTDVISFEQFVNLVHEDDKENIQALKEQILLQQNKNEYIYKIVNKQDKIKYISLHWQFSYNRKNELSHIDGYIIDSTEKVLAQQELENQHSLLLHQQKLVQQGEMLSMIAHQWRQPLTAVSATTSNLLFKNVIGEKLDSKELNDELTLISEYTQYLSSTIDDFRYFFKVEKEKTACSLEELVEQSLNINKVSMDSHDIKVIKNYNCGKKITSYCNEIKQVILNLLKNAEDVLVERQIKDKKIFIETKSDAQSVILSINDNSGGIDSKLIDKVFEPYFSTKSSQDGTGLGLYMSSTIINKHCKGKLSVENNEHGAIFTIRLNLES